VPLAGNSSRPKVKNVIDQVNRSILGSLHENAVRDIVYNVLSPSKGAITEIIRDDDLLGYEIESTGKNVAQKVISKYRHEDADIFTGEIDSDVIEVTNTVVANLSDIFKRGENRPLLMGSSECLNNVRKNKPTARGIKHNHKNEVQYKILKQLN